MVRCGTVLAGLLVYAVANGNVNVSIIDHWNHSARSIDSNDTMHWTHNNGGFDDGPQHVRVHQTQRFSL